MKESYILTITKGKAEKKITIYANDNNHAVAQAEDISRALDAEKFQVSYGDESKTLLSCLFKKLAFNNFKYDQCDEWTGSHTNETPCLYLFKKRLYVRNIILKYLDIPKDDCVTKLTCKNTKCTNPYHFCYVPQKNSKISGADRGLAVAYLSQGASVSQVASALNVHRSTIYRNLKHECFHPRSASNGNGSGR